MFCSRFGDSFLDKLDSDGIILDTGIAIEPGEQSIRPAAEIIRY